MAFDIDLACYNAVSGMSGYAPLTALVKPNCFLFQTQAEYNAKRAQFRAPNDYPQVRLEQLAGFGWNTAAPRTFCMMRTGYTAADVDFGMPGQLQLLITLVHEQAKLTAQTPLELAVRKFLASKWPTLGVVDGTGIICVNGYGVAGRRRDESSDITGGALRTVTRLALTISARVKLSQVTA